MADKYPDTVKSLLDGDEKKVLAKAQSILKSIIRPEMGEFDKELAIYDYLATYGAYDYSSYALHTGRPVVPEDPPANPEAYNVYGALVDALAVCEGWSDAYQLLFTLVGLKSETPIGSLSGEPHKWVSVQVDGEWYQIEATKKAEKGSSSLYSSTFNFTYQDANDFLSYSGGDERAISQKYDYMNRMDRERNPDKSPFEFEEEEAAAAAERAKVATRQLTRKSTP
ncbi:transglutaminase domain-containing protein [Cohnella herbarum]|uniref:Transglutaminase-like domain-containing protein n=1 Tax=Cohnella herbarum TaxID=2728023 RepID=A0A7Z2VEU0_9BACL|nr:hypothetical protein [Cohnella herbarum]QJD81828.1 hypothetical protein HH215_00635 [Cohnella herbarum]